MQDASLLIYSKSLRLEFFSEMFVSVCCLSARRNLTCSYNHRKQLLVYDNVVGLSLFYVTGGVGEGKAILLC